MFLGQENFIGKAVMIKREVASHHSYNINRGTALPSWQNISNITTIEYIFGRIAGLVIGDGAVFCYIINFETGEIGREQLDCLTILFEENTGKEHFVVTPHARFHIKNDRLHRDDGPAIESTNENTKDRFYLYGAELKPEEYIDALSEEKQVGMLFHLDKLK